MSKSFCTDQQNLFLRGRIDTEMAERQYVEYAKFLFLKGRIDTKKLNLDDPNLWKSFLFLKGRIDTEKRAQVRAEKERSFYSLKVG
jgi:hypothetical protein